MKKIILLFAFCVLAVQVFSADTIPASALVIPEIFSPGILFQPDTAANVVLMAVGDVLLDRAMGQRIDEFGTGYPFSNVVETFKKADLVAANLECPISAGGKAQKKKFVFRAKPFYVDALKKGYIDVVSLANNHMLDYGSSALLDTVRILDEAGIKRAGAGGNSDEAHRPCFIEKNGIRIAFFSYTGFMSYSKPQNYGSPCAAYADFDLEKEIRGAKKEADIVIISFHWGGELDDTPTVTQRKLAHRAVMGGADVVLGHHPHTLQGIERYRGKLICYSLGNFVFTSPTPKTWDTIILELRLSKDGTVDHHIIPVRIENLRPRLANEEESRRILAHVEKVSEGLTELASDKETPIIK